MGISRTFKNKIIISSVGGDWHLFYPMAMRVVNLALSVLKKEDNYLEVYFLDNKIMSFLNKRFRGKSGPTDVLTFPWPSSFKFPEFNKKPLGEIYLAMDYIKSKGADWRYLLVHGLLHVFNFDHIKKDDTIKMELKEKKICRVAKIRPALSE